MRPLPRSVQHSLGGHGRFDVPTAIGLAQEMAPFRPTWFEEPIPPESIPALADVRAKSPVAIATGERYYEPQRFRELIDARAADYLQPDVSHVGGLGEAKRIAALAHLIPSCVDQHSWAQSRNPSDMMRQG